MNSSEQFIEHFQSSASKAGCSASIDHAGIIALENCGVAELSVLIGELHHQGYSIVNSRKTREGFRLGIMSVRGEIPEFLSVPLRSPSVEFPEVNGLFLAFLGPDGVGKTTTVTNTMNALQPVFDEQHLYHWRPQMIKPRAVGDENTADNGWLAINRHGDPPRGKLVSLLRLAGVYADYWYGHMRAIAPALHRGALVVFDRYYHDILVDSLRSRYGGPRWLLPLLKKFLPQRDVLFVVLDADDKVILGRKQEVSPEELRIQRAKYAKLVRKLPYSLHVRTDYGEQKTVAEVLRGIGDHLSHRFDKRLLKHAPSIADRKLQSQPVTVAKVA